MKKYPLHPSVVYCEEGYAGHKFWMAETPFPPFRMNPYRDRWELPCIHYSDDGLTWNSIEGNPIDDISESQIADKGFFSDTHLLLHNNQLECFYRLYEHNGTHTVIYRKTTCDGSEWGERETIVDNEVVAHRAKLGATIISPAFIYEKNGLWMWYVDDEPVNEKRGISVSTLKNDVWEDRKSCFLDNDIVPWHIDVQYHDGLYHLLVYDFEQRLSYYTSADGLKFKFIKTILQPSYRYCDYFSTSLYRACMTWANDKMHIYFSAVHGHDFSSIGLLSVDNGGKIELIDGYKGVQKVKYWWFFMCCVLDHVKRIIKKKTRL